MVLLLAAMLGACGGTAKDGETGATALLIDPQCIDGKYSEQLPDPSPSIADVTAAYQPSAAVETVLTVLDRRYPFGRAQVAEAEPKHECIKFFLGGMESTMGGLLQGLSTVVHECGHYVDGDRSTSFSSNSYVIKPDLVLSCAQGNSTDLGGLTFARSRIRKDAFAAAWPPCPASDPFGACDSYADVYLTGDPDDRNFDSGDQGFNMLLEEAVQYVNSLVTARSFAAELTGNGSSISDRDGILTMLWYVERYLGLARSSYPAAYDHLLHGDGGCWRNAILTVWGRAWLYLDATKDQHHLGLHDKEIEALVEKPELLGEIQRVRQAQGCK